MNPYDKSSSDELPKLYFVRKSLFFLYFQRTALPDRVILIGSFFFPPAVLIIEIIFNSDKLLWS